MSRTTFKTNPRSLRSLLEQCDSGKIQLPDFQRSWVWAEDRILSLVASISQAFDKTDFYQHDANWSNRMLLGDSLQV